MKPQNVLNHQCGDQRNRRRNGVQDDERQRRAHILGYTPAHVVSYKQRARGKSGKYVAWEFRFRNRKEQNRSNEPDHEKNVPRLFGFEESLSFS